MASPIEIIGQNLVDAGLCYWSDEAKAAPAWPVWLSTLPFAKGQDNTAVGLFGPQGRLQGRIMRTGESVRFPGLQVRTQNVDYGTAYEKINAIYVHLTQTVRRTNVTVKERQYRIDNVSPTTGVIEMGINNETDLQNFSANFYVRVTALT